MEAIAEVILAALLLVAAMVLAAGRGGVGHNPTVPRAVVMRNGRLELADDEEEAR